MSGAQTIDGESPPGHDYGMEGSERVAKEKGTRAGFVITDNDLAILKFIHDYRLLKIEQVGMLTGRTYTRVHRRLKGLYDAGLLRRIEVPQKPDIYFLGRRALALLLSHGLITDTEAERRSREHELRPATLDHEMLIADIHTALEVATRTGALKLTGWREGESLRDRFQMGMQTVVIQPDAFFQIKDTRLPEGKNRRTFLLEADRSTMGIASRAGSQRFRDKIERYHWFLEKGRAFDVYGVRSIRILTLTLTRERRDNLCADADGFLVEHKLTQFRKFFLFGSLQDAQGSETILSSIFHRPGVPHPYPLFPPLAEIAESA